VERILTNPGTHSRAIAGQSIFFRFPVLHLPLLGGEHFERAGDSSVTWPPGWLAERWKLTRYKVEYAGLERLWAMAGAIG
jgi:hypothetical protein